MTFDGYRQSRRASLIESITNTVVGYGINLAGQIVLFPIFGIHVPLSVNLAIGLAFTGLSIARGFVLRRGFEAARINGWIV